MKKEFSGQNRGQAGTRGVVPVMVLGKQGGTPFSMGAGRWVLNAQSRFGQDSALPVMSCKVLIVGNEEVKGVEAFKPGGGTEVQNVYVQTSM